MAYKKEEIMIRTRFAPSPTGFLHIGGVRTALFSWAFARRHQGKFVLRIEDTDLERSTPESVAAILDGMRWVGLTYDEGPFYQTQRFDRYRDVLQQLLASGHAYYCYCSRQELEQMRAEQEARGEKPRYNGMWRPEEGKTLPDIPADVSPVIRFKTPKTGSIAWDDLVKGRIEIQNSELDDLILARPDGSPTYNFCVVVDDWDMQISHVIRGDDHVNNTPRQIHILQALGATLPKYAHLPMILNPDGQKMSKRRDAVSVVDYADQGILPAALLNYLARLGWGHGDDEVFSVAQFIEWFDLANVSPSASRFDPEKLAWINQQHIKMSAGNDLKPWILPRLAQLGITDTARVDLAAVLDLLKDRAKDLNDLAAQTLYFYARQTPSDADVAKHFDAAARERMLRFADVLANLNAWTAADIHALFKPFCAAEGIKMGQLGMPLRVAVCGTTQTPSIDAVLALLGQAEVLARLRASCI